MKRDLVPFVMWVWDIHIESEKLLSKLHSQRLLAYYSTIRLTDSDCSVPLWSYVDVTLEVALYCPVGTAVIPAIRLSPVVLLVVVDSAR